MQKLISLKHFTIAQLQDRFISDLNSADMHSTRKQIRLYMMARRRITKSLEGKGYDRADINNLIKDAYNMYKLEQEH